MQQRTLFQGEQVIAQWTILTLTTHRIWCQAEEFGTETVNTALLQKVDGVSIKRYVFNWFLILSTVSGFLGLLLLALGLLTQRNVDFVALGLSATMFLCFSVSMALYLFYRKTVLIIHAGSVNIGAIVHGGDSGQRDARAFAHQVEAAVCRVITR
jgi:hypothetical protein